MKNKEKKVIEWENPGSDDIIYRWKDDELNWGTALVVREYEIAAFFRDGKLFDIFQPGRYILSTQNLPLLTRAYQVIMGYKKTPFKADVIFLSQKIFQGLWGIRTMVKAMKDMESPMPLKANGDYQFRVNDPTIFLTQVVGGLKNYSSIELNKFLKGFLNEKLIQTLSTYYYMDVYSNLEKTSTKVQVNIAENLSQRGMDLVNLKIYEVETEEEYERDLYNFQRFRSGAGEKYRQYMTLDKMADAVGSSDGGAAVGTGMLLFPAMYQQMMQNSGKQSQTPPSSVICPHCKSVIPSNSHFCPNCGKKIIIPVDESKNTEVNQSKKPGKNDKLMICPYCGKDLVLPKTPNFCPYCKEKLK